MYSSEDLLMISGLQHIAFCERQWALIHLEQQWNESVDTIRGEAFHERVHAKGYSSVGNVRSQRGVRLVSYQLGLTGIADIVEFEQTAQGTYTKKGKKYIIRPVEYKVGKPKIEDWDRIQVCAQALCIEEMFGCSIESGALFYGKTRRREIVEINPKLKQQVVLLAARMHILYAAQKTPEPAMHAKCKRCSLKDDCVPEIAGRSVRKYWNKHALALKGEDTR